MWIGRLGISRKTTNPVTISPSIPPRDIENSTTWTISATAPRASPFCHHRGACRPRKNPRPMVASMAMATQLLSIPAKPASRTRLKPPK